MLLLDNEYRKEIIKVYSRESDRRTQALKLVYCRTKDTNKFRLHGLSSAEIRFLHKQGFVFNNHLTQMVKGKSLRSTINYLNELEY